MLDGHLGRLASKIRYLARRHALLYRLRYSWIVESGGIDFEAPPEASEAAPFEGAPPEFRSFVAEIQPFDGRRFDDILRLAYALSHGHARGPGLGVSSARALAAIRRGGAGVCSDYSQVFLGLCRTAGVPCREWGLTASFHRHGVGHALNEVWVEEFDRWVFLDAYLSVYATRRGEGVPLGLTEMIDLACRGRRHEIELHAIDEDAVDASLRSGYLGRYLDPGHFFFVLSNNDVFLQDRYLEGLGFLPLPILHVVMLMAGVYQRFHVYSNEANRDRMEEGLRRLRRFKIWTIGLSATVIAVAVGLLGSAVVMGESR